MNFEPEGSKDPMDALGALTERVKAVLAPLGVSVEQLWFAPAPPGAPGHMAQGVFLVDRDAAFKSLEEQQIDAQFKEMALQERYAAEQEKVENARKALIESLGDGILGGDDETDLYPPDSSGSETARPTGPSVDVNAIKEAIAGGKSLQEAVAEQLQSITSELDPQNITEMLSDEAKIRAALEEELKPDGIFGSQGITGVTFEDDDDPGDAV